MTDEQKETDVQLLDMITYRISNDISNYALEDVEDLLDEDMDQIVRSHWMSRGNASYSVVVTPSGLIKAMDRKTPRDLLTQVANTLIQMYIDAIDDE